MKKSMLILMVGIFWAAPVWGGTLALEQVSSEANWVVHVDMEWIRQSHLGQLMRQELAETDAEVQLENFATIYSIHPLDDIHSITVYGRGQDESGAVVLVKATFDREKLLALVRTNDTYEEINYGEHIIHSWQDKRHKDEKCEKFQYGSIYNQDLLVIGGSREVLEKALDVLDGKAENAQAGGLLGLMNYGQAGIMLIASAQGMDEITAHKQAMALKQTESLQLAIGEIAQKFYIDVNLTAKSAEAAENIGKMGQGILAFAMMAGQNHPELIEMVRAVELSWQGKNVKLYFEWNSDDLYAVLKQKWQQEKQKNTQEPQEQQS